MHQNYHGIADAGLIAGTAMAWYAIFNGLGRIQMASDRIEENKRSLP
ncbi:MAG: hypothetical protein R2759_20690 [Bacteroidales bacterium]